MLLVALAWLGVRSVTLLGPPPRTLFAPTEPNVATALALFEIDYVTPQQWLAILDAGRTFEIPEDVRGGLWRDRPRTLHTYIF